MLPNQPTMATDITLERLGYGQENSVEYSHPSISRYAFSSSKKISVPLGTAKRDSNNYILSNSNSQRTRIGSSQERAPVTGSLRTTPKETSHRMHTRHDTQGSAGNESKRMKYNKSR